MKNRIENTIQYNTCVPKETMIAYIINTLDKKSFLNVRAHLEGCEYCSEAFSGLKQMDDFSALHSLPTLWEKRTGLKSSAGTSSYISKITRGIVSVAIVITCVLCLV